MAQVQQVPVSPLNGIPEKNGNGLNIDESSAGIAHIQNGSVLIHDSPTKDLNGSALASTSLEADDLGDLRRRSTRASALKAQEKIKLKDDIVQGPQKRELDEAEGEEVVEGGAEGTQTAPKKRRLETGKEFDQTCFRFGLRTNDDGEVYAMTDESENSSIHDSEMEVVRYHYEKMKNREPDAEQLKERLKMRREAESALREEEASLLVLRKMKDSQNRAITKLAAETKAADLAEAANAGAYKPVVANPNGKSVNGKSSSGVTPTKALAGLANLTIPQQLDLLQKLSTQSPAAKQAYLLAKKNPAQTTTIFAQLIALNNSHQQKQQQQKEADTSSAMAAQQQAQVQITQSKLLSQQTPAQRIQAARLAFRAQADKQLMTISTQKSQPHEITFLPNPNASAFLALHGLDQVVQHVLKDRSHEKPYDGPAYECEECKTDCAPTWKAIGSSQDELHLYCENCVRAAQKRKNRADQTSLLKRAFQKISAQEKEFEKKIAEGQLEQFVEAKATTAVTPSVPTSSMATVSTAPLAPRLPNMPSSSGTSTPTQAMKSSTPISSTPKSSSSNNAKKALAQQQQQQLSQMMSQMMSTQMMKNPGLMQQMMQMYMAQQVAQAQAATRNIPNSNMALLMAQAQAAQAQVAQAQAAQAQAIAQAQAAAQAKSARESAQQQQQQQQQQAMIIAAMLANQSSGMNSTIIQQLQKMTPSQQKSFIDALKNNSKK